MIQIKKIFFLLGFLIVVVFANAQVITGQHDCKMHYIFLNPIGKPTISGYGGSNFYIDLDGDLQNDFRLTYFNSGGLGGNGQSNYLAPIGSGQIAYGWTDSAFSIGCNPQWRYYDRADTLNFNDTINANLNWKPSYTTFWASGYLMGGSPPCNYSSPNNPSYNNKYIGLRIFKNSDTLYGWIKMKNSSGLGIEEICCEVEPYAPLINTPLIDETLNCGDFYSHPLNVIASTDVYYQWSKDGIEIPGATGGLLSFNHISQSDSGVYSCMVWNCFDTVYTSAQIAVAPKLPTIPPRIDDGHSWHCEGWSQPFYLVVNNMKNNILSYQWLKDGNVIIGEINDSIILNANDASTSGFYSCRTNVLTNDFCIDSIYNEEFITNEVLFDVRATTYPIITQNGNQLMSNYPSGNSWYFQNCCTSAFISNDQTITISEDAQYSLSVQNEYCSWATNWQDFYVQFTVNPNPFENEIIVTLNHENRDVSWELINDLGITILKGKIYSTINTINTTTIAKGHYYLKINRQVMKMIKQ